MDKKHYLLRIRLLGIEPEIWRRFVVPLDITLDRLHDVIQIVMGWTDSHLHEFTIGKKRYTEYPESTEDGLECGKYCLGDLIKQKGRNFRYLYDFGDSWEHELILEDNRYVYPELQSAVECLDGARACPPEDVGSISGYYEFCEAVKDPKHEEHESYLVWCGGEYDREKFSAGEVNWELLKYLRWSRERLRPWSAEY